VRSSGTCNAWLAALFCATSCAGPVAGPSDAGSGGGLFFDVVQTKPDAASQDAEDGQSADAAAQDPDVSSTVDTPRAALGLSVAVTATLYLGTKAAVTVGVDRGDGVPTPPGADEKWTLLVDGQPLALGAPPAADLAQQPAVVAWPHSEAGQAWIAAVRPGVVRLSVQLGDQVSDEVEVAVQTPEGAGMRLVAPAGEGETPGERVKDNDETIKLEGKTFGSGGLTLTVRFPAASLGGEAYDLAKPAPNGGSLQVNAIVPALGSGGGKQLKILKGALWIDQVDEGWYRGSLLGTAADLTPVVGWFAVPRKGEFGVDLIGEAVTVAESTTLKYTDTGTHASRVSLGHLGGSTVQVTWRQVDSVTTGSLQRLAFDALSGGVQPLDPLVKSCQAKVLVDDGQGGQAEQAQGEFIGWSSGGERDGVRLVVWEGKAAKGAAPYQITAQPLDAQLQPQGPALVVSSDACWGKCRPQLVALPSSRWLVVWAAPAGGVKAALLDANDFSQVEKTATLAPAPATNPSVAALDANVGVLWRDPTQGSRFRLYSDKLASNGVETSLGGKVVNGGPPAMVAVWSQPSFAALFFDPPTTLKVRRIDLNAALVGAADLALASDTLRLAAAAGKDGQVAIVERTSAKINATVSQLRLRKVQFTGADDAGQSLGEAVVVAEAKSSVPLEVALVYVPEADTYVVAWSGDASSQGVQLRRFH
jgi:hypothetical protein